MENLRKRVKVRLVNNAKGNIKYVSKPNFVSQNIFNRFILPCPILTACMASPMACMNIVTRWMVVCVFVQL